MSKALVLTLIAADRPGLIERVSEVIAEHGGSWEQSRMARLAGRFAGILQVAVDDDATAALTEALASLASEGLDITVETGAHEIGMQAGIFLEAEIVGQDRPGIVREIASAIAAVGVNVLALESHVSPAPMSGETLFTARVQLQAPGDLDLDTLRESLEKIADELMAEFQIDHA